MLPLGSFATTRRADDGGNERRSQLPSRDRRVGLTPRNQFTPHPKTGWAEDLSTMKN